MTQKKKVFILVACLALMLIGTMTTLAYFTDQEKATNTFTVGKVYIDLDEADVDDSTPNADRDQENKYHLLPGQTYTKDPIVHVLADSEECYVYVTVDNQISDIECDDKGYKNIAVQMAENNWEPLKDEKGQQVLKDNKHVYVYKAVVAKNKTQNTDLLVFANFKIDGEKGTNESLKKHNEKDSAIVVNAYAIQAVGFDNAFHEWSTASGEFTN